MELNRIFLNKKQKIYISKNQSKNSKQNMATLMKNISSLGYALSPKLIEILQTYSPSELKKFEEETVSIIKEMVGGDVEYNPMYPNFPKQVMELSDAELFFNAMLHYLTSIWLEGSVEPWLPNYPVEEREKLQDIPNLKVIDYGSLEEFTNLIRNMIISKVEMSDFDKGAVDWYLSEPEYYVRDMLPDKIENKENMAFVVGKLHRHGILKDSFKFVKTATDVLRVITALSDGDVSLSINSKFRNFNRSERREILNLLENCGNIEEDMARNINRWIRVGEILHPSEYTKQYPKTSEAFRKVRNEKIRTFGGKLHKFMEAKNITNTVSLLQLRAGEFARNLDWVLRTYPDDYEHIISGFGMVADNVSTKVLLQLATHFKYRNDEKYRAFIPKGKVSKISVIENDLPEIPKKVCMKVCKVCVDTLMDRFAEREPLGKIFIDEKLMNYNIPFAMRSANTALKTIARGSRVDMDSTKGTSRLFIWWTDNHKVGRVDIDLSAVFYDEEWNHKGHVSYTNLRDKARGVYHSGDITTVKNKKKGACEFIDLDRQMLLNSGVRYVMMSVNSFTGQQFNTIPRCYAGCMERDKVQSGEIFEPSTVTHKFNLASESKICIPLIFDLKENQFIWVDLVMESRTHMWGNNVESNITGTTALGIALTHLHKPSLWVLFMLHAKRGKIVDNKEDADTIFSIDEGIKPTDIDEITANYL